MCILPSFSQIAALIKVLYIYKKQYIDTIYQSYSDLPTFTCIHLYVFLCSPLYNFITCIASCVYLHIPDSGWFPHSNNPSFDLL